MADDSPQHADAPTSTDAPTLTHRDIEILIAGFRSFKSAPEIDNAQLTAALGLSNPRSSTNAWRNLTKKLQGDQVPVLPSGSKDGPKAKGSAKSRATKTPTLDDKPENEVQKPTTMSATPSLGASENIATAAPVVTKANNTGVPSPSADTATPTNTDSKFQSNLKESASALIPATPDLYGADSSVADTPTKSEPATPTPAPSAPAPPAGKKCDSQETDPANAAVVEEETKPTKKARKAPVKKAKSKQANSETGTLDAESAKPAPKKRRAPAKKAAEEDAPIDGTEGTATHEPDEPKPKRQRKAAAKKSAAPKQPKKTAAAGKKKNNNNNNKATESEAALFAAEKAEAEAKKEQIKKAVQEANAVLKGEGPTTTGITESVDEDTTTTSVEQFTSSGTTSSATNTDEDVYGDDDAEAIDQLNAAIAAAYDDAIDSLLDLNTAAITPTYPATATATIVDEEAMTAAVIRNE